METEKINAVLAVIIATKNRSDAIERYALSSLEHSTFRNFICIVWDASDDEKTRTAVNGRKWNFVRDYSKAPRPGLTSQRNDAVRYTLNNYPDVRYLLFIDDDCEISDDALDGIVKTFSTVNTDIVNLPMYPKPGEKLGGCGRFIKRMLGFTRHGVTDFLYNYGSPDELAGADMDWASGGGLAIDVRVFNTDKCGFPEEFQRFGGYALGEDMAFTYFLKKLQHRRIVGSLGGHFLHWSASGGRPDIRGITASKWYNFHLLFDALYSDVHGLRKLWLTVKFKLFMCAAAVQALRRSRSLDVPSAIRGINDARRALKEYYKTHSSEDLFKC